MSVGNDGDMNLLNAIMVATARSSRGKTVLVADQKILSARAVLKGSEIPGGFTAGLVGPLGFVRRPDEGQYSISNVDSFVTYYREPTRKGRASSEFNIKTLIAPDGSFRTLPRVEVLPSRYDARVDVIDALVRLGAQGLVVTGLPPGGVRVGRSPTAWTRSQQKECSACGPTRRLPIDILLDG